MLVDGDPDARSFPSLLLRAIDEDDDVLCQVAIECFGDWRGCRLVTDLERGGESLVNEVAEARLRGTPVEETTLVRLLRVLVDAGMRLALWEASDYLGLPVASNWSDLLALVQQVQTHPAELYALFDPLGGT